MHLKNGEKVIVEITGGRIFSYFQKQQQSQKTLG